ncbi:MAG: hypothetical protein ABI760_02750 [Ferruginibacter sp.]
MKSKILKKTKKPISRDYAVKSDDDPKEPILTNILKKNLETNIRINAVRSNDGPKKRFYPIS